jgi:hypothetical protein
MSEADAAYGFGEDASPFEGAVVVFGIWIPL